MKKNVLIFTISFFLASVLVGCKYILDDEVEKQNSSPFGVMDFESIREEEMRAKMFQMKLKQRGVRGGRGGF